MHANRPIVGEYFLENLPERSIVKFNCTDMEPCIYPLGTQRYFEWLFRETKRLAIERGIPLSVFHDVCSLYQCEPGVAPDTPFEVTSAFLMLDGPIDIEGAETLPGGTHATIYLDKAYDLGSNDNNISFAYGVKMLDYVEEKGFETRGAMYGEPLCRYSRMLDESGDMLFRMCVPIQLRKDPPRMIFAKAATRSRKRRSPALAQTGSLRLTPKWTTCACLVFAPAFQFDIRQQYFANRTTQETIF